MDDAAAQFREFLKAWLESNGWTKYRLATESDIDESIISRWLSDDPRRRTQPSDAKLRALSAVIQVPAADLMRMAGRLPGPVSEDVARAKPSVLVQQRTLSDNYDRWMAVMGPRMGEQKAHDHYWQMLVSNSANMVSAVESILQGDTPPSGSTAVSGQADTAVSDVVSDQPRRANRRPGKGRDQFTGRYHRLEVLESFALGLANPPLAA